MRFSSLKYPITVFVAVFIMGISFLGSAYLLSETNFYIRDSSSAVTKEGEVVNTINVSGDGKVYVKPDMATISASVSETRDSSEDALKASNEKINEVRSIAKNNNVKDEDIKTTDLSISADYNYRNGESVYVGQRASQSLSIKIKDIDDSTKRLTKIIDAVAEIEGVRLGGMTFGIEDKTKYFKSARELAYQKALQKGSELAELSNLELFEPVMISEQTRDFDTSTKYRNTANEVADFSQETEVSTGQLEVTVSLSVKFGVSPK